MTAGSMERNGIKVAVVTGQHAFDVPGVHALCTVLARGIQWAARSLEG
jgi:hypothetical protein